MDSVPQTSETPEIKNWNKYNRKNTNIKFVLTILKTMDIKYLFSEEASVTV